MEVKKIKLVIKKVRNFKKVFCVDNNGNYYDVKTKDNKDLFVKIYNGLHNGIYEIEFNSSDCKFFKKENFYKKDKDLTYLNNVLQFTKINSITCLNEDNSNKIEKIKEEDLPF